MLISGWCYFLFAYFLKIIFLFFFKDHTLITIFYGISLEKIRIQHCGGMGRKKSTKTKPLPAVTILLWTSSGTQLTPEICTQGPEGQSMQESIVPSNDSNQSSQTNKYTMSLYWRPSVGWSQRKSHPNNEVLWASQCQAEPHLSVSLLGGQQIAKRTTQTHYTRFERNFKAVTSVLPALQTWQVAAVLFHKRGRLNQGSEVRNLSRPHSRWLAELGIRTEVIWI